MEHVRQWNGDKTAKFRGKWGWIAILEAGEEVASSLFQAIRNRRGDGYE